MLDHSNNAVSRRMLALLFLFALAGRAGFGTVQMLRQQQGVTLTFPDEQQYWQISRSLRSGLGLQDELGMRATRMPLFPGILALLPDAPNGLVLAKLAQWLVGALVAPLTALLGASLLDRRAGMIAALIVSVDPGLVGLSSLLLTETPFICALLALWWVGQPLVRVGREGHLRTWIATGLLAALCIYIRPSAAALAIVWVLFLLLCQRKVERSWLRAAIALTIVLLALVPWAWRNQRTTGHWCWLTHRMGISLYDGVGPDATGAGDLGQIKQMSEVAGLDEVAWNSWFLAESWASIRSDPARIAQLAGVKLARTWSPILHAEEYSSAVIRIVFAAWTIPLFGLAAAGTWLLRKRWAALCVLLGPALYLAALHSLFVGSIRYRMAAMPMLSLLAAVAIIALYDRVKTSPAARGR